MSRTSENKKSAPAWLLEFQGHTKPLDELESPELRAMLEPVYEHLSRALSEIPDTDDLRGLEIVFYFATDGILKFRLQGPPLAVDSARDQLGGRAEILSSKH